MIRPFNKPRMVFVEDRMHRNDDHPEETQQEIACLKMKLRDLQQLVAELLLENERLRHAQKLQSD